MYQVYILQSLKDSKTYVGYTNDLARRLGEHNSGRSIATKHRAPFKLLFSEEFPTIADAKKRELYWKSGGGRRKLEKLFEETKKQLKHLTKGRHVRFHLPVQIVMQFERGSPSFLGGPLHILGGTTIEKIFIGGRIS